jgi:hypothetical protein
MNSKNLSKNKLLLSIAMAENIDLIQDALYHYELICIGEKGMEQILYDIKKLLKSVEKLNV